MENFKNPLDQKRKVCAYFEQQLLCLIEKEYKLIKRQEIEYERLEYYSSLKKYYEKMMEKTHPQNDPSFFRIFCCNLLQKRRKSQLTNYQEVVKNYDANIQSIIGNIEKEEANDHENRVYKNQLKTIISVLKCQVIEEVKSENDCNLGGYEEKPKEKILI